MNQQSKGQLPPPLPRVEGLGTSEDPVGHWAFLHFLPRPPLSASCSAAAPLTPPHKPKVPSPVFLKNQFPGLPWWRSG